MDRRQFLKTLFAVPVAARAAPLVARAASVIPAPIVPIVPMRQWGVDFEWTEIESPLALALLRREDRDFYPEFKLPFQAKGIVAARVPERYQVRA